MRNLDDLAETLLVALRNCTTWEERVEAVKSVLSHVSIVFDEE